jgi:hypothetical protein
MSRILKIIFYAFLLIFVYLWISTVYKSCGDQPASNDSNEQVMMGEEENEVIENYQDLTGISDDDEFEGGDNNTSSNTSNDAITLDAALDQDYSEDLTQEVKSEPVVSKPKAKPKPAPQETYTAPRNNASSYKVGDYLIVAGSYSIASNANKMVSKLRKMGYDNAETVQFDASQFSSVVASRHSNYDAAVNAANSLKSRGVDCYVHRKK